MRTPIKHILNKYKTILSKSFSISSCTGQSTSAVYCQALLKGSVFKQGQAECSLSQNHQWLQRETGYIQNELLSS